MGIYLNPGNERFQQSVNSEIYVDKTKMLMETNSFLRTEQKYVCISRPHRFGKSMADNMLTAYYSRGCNSKGLFSPFKIAAAESFEKHLNQYNVIQINMADFAKKSDSLQEVLKSLQDSIVEEIMREYPDFRMPRYPSLLSVLEWHFLQFKQPFIIIIDDWDCIIKMKQFTVDDQMDYLHFLLVLLKDKSYVTLAFMAGILPVKKSGNQLSVDMFTEVTMTFAAPYDEFSGFTEEEVVELCQMYHYDDLCNTNTELFFPRLALFLHFILVM